MRPDGSGCSRRAYRAVFLRSSLASLTVSGVGFLDRATQRCRTQCGNEPEACVADDETLSQYGEEQEFHNRNRINRQEPGLSVQRGRWTPEELCRYLYGDPPEPQLQMADARYTTARRLREAGFQVIHTPGKLGYQANHATVAWLPIFNDEGAVLAWTAEATSLFDACFN